MVCCAASFCDVRGRAAAQLRGNIDAKSRLNSKEKVLICLHFHSSETLYPSPQNINSYYYILNRHFLRRINGLNTGHLFGPEPDPDRTSAFVAITLFAY